MNFLERNYLTEEERNLKKMRKKEKNSCSHCYCVIKYRPSYYNFLTVNLFSYIVVKCSKCGYTKKVSGVTPKVTNWEGLHWYSSKYKNRENFNIY